jgi:hypothetical protein
MTMAEKQTRAIGSLATSIVLLVFLLSLSGCFLAPSYIQDAPIGNVNGENAYVVMKQKLGAGNLDRMGLTLYLNGRVKNGDTKGIELESADKFLPTIAVYGELKKVADGSPAAYHVWEIPADKLASGGAAALMFIRNIESQKLAVFGIAVPDMVYGAQNSPFECMLISIPDGDAVEEKDKPVKRINLFSGIPLKDRNAFKMLQENRLPGATFMGHYFIIDKPGVYYLGDMEVAGELSKLERENILGKDRIALKKFAVGVQDNPDQAKAYLAQWGLTPPGFYDLSPRWQDIYMGDFRTYVDAPLSLKETYLE